MLTDIEIAESIQPQHILEVAGKLGLNEHDVTLYGDHKAKVKKKINPRKDSKLVLVSAITPTSAGIGKTTVSIGLADALKAQGESVCLALREPSLGPVFGIKGGATGGGYSQIIPMADINLHFTGDFHAITTANNLLCATIDNHIFQGNELNLDINRIEFHRCLDMNDRALRYITINNGSTGMRKEKFTITAASEIMAIMCLAKDLTDLKRRLGNILVAYNIYGSPIFARDLKIVDAMAIVLKDALLPNLVQTLAGTPALVHMGPFANIAHGCNSIIATNLSRTLAKYTITEAGFGSDLGGEKFIDIKCRESGISPDAVVLVATIQALRLHGGVGKSELSIPNTEAVKLGLENLLKHIHNIKVVFNLPLVVTLNKYDCDTDEEIQIVKDAVNALNVPFVLNEVWGKGAEGAMELASIVTTLCENNSELTFAYNLEDSIEDKIETIAKSVYGAQGILLEYPAMDKIREIEKLGLANLPIVIAKTQYSFSDNAKLLGAPSGFILTINDIELKSGAEFIVAIAGNMMLMPGLSKEPTGTKMKINSNGHISGLK